MNSCFNAFPLRDRKVDAKIRTRRRFTQISEFFVFDENTTVGGVFILWHFAQAAANLLTNDALDPQALIPEFKACAVQVRPVREENQLNPKVLVHWGRH